MAKLLENFSLLAYNSFKINATARYFFQFEKEEDLQQFLKHNSIADTKFLILGEGCNVLFTDDYDSLILHPQNTEIEIIEENSDSVLVKAGAGKNWDEFVEWTVSNNYAGLENLSLIPGSVGASPIQNIGAYGAEVKDCIEKLDAVSTRS